MKLVGNLIEFPERLGEPPVLPVLFSSARSQPIQPHNVVELIHVGTSLLSQFSSAAFCLWMMDFSATQAPHLGPKLWS